MNKLETFLLAICGVLISTSALGFSGGEKLDGKWLCSDTQNKGSFTSTMKSRINYNFAQKTFTGDAIVTFYNNKNNHSSEVMVISAGGFEFKHGVVITSDVHVNVHIRKDEIGFLNQEAITGLENSFGANNNTVWKTQELTNALWTRINRLDGSVITCNKIN